MRESEIMSRMISLNKLAASSAVVRDEQLEDARAIIENLQEELGAVKEQLELLAEKNREFERLSITDQLTELYNQRHFHDILDQEVARSRRQGCPLCLLFFDVDSLKTYNDTYGHIGGNEVLKTVAQSLSQNIKDTDSGYRYGGDEFAVILPGTRAEQAMDVARNISKSLRKTNFQYVSLSIGVVELTTEMDSNVFFRHADEAMYMAKKYGVSDSNGFTNKICVYASDITEFVSHKTRRRPLRESWDDTRY